MSEPGASADNTAKDASQVGVQAGRVDHATVNITKTENHYHGTVPRWPEASGELGSSNVARLTPDSASRRFTDGTLRLSWVRDGSTELILETDDFDVSLGRNTNNRVHLPDSRDGRFHGHLSLEGAALVYRHLGRHPAYLVNATRQLTIAQGDSCPVGDKDRLQFASGTMLIECSVPDLYDPNARPTSSVDEARLGRGH
jgi:hypothetical protein